MIHHKINAPAAEENTRLAAQTSLTDSVYGCEFNSSPKKGQAVASPLQPLSYFSRAVQKARRFLLDVGSLDCRGLKVVSGGWEMSAREYRIKRDRFPYHVIEFVAGGTGSLELAGRIYPLRRGTVFTFGPLSPYEVVSNPDDPLSKYFVAFVGSEALSTLRLHALQPGTCREVVEADEVQAAFEGIIADGRQATEQTNRILALQVEILLLRMASTPGASPSQHRSFQTFLRCRQYLDEHFLEVRNAGQAAVACHVDAAYLSRLFARYHQNSLHNYLLWKKMLWAAALLDEGEVLVRDVADKLGMEAFHFSRVFKRMHGISPSSFIRLRESISNEA